MQSRTATQSLPDTARLRLFLLALITLAILASGIVQAAAPGQKVTVPLNKSITLSLEQPAKRIAVGNPGVADIVILRGNEVQVIGKALGATNLVAWNDSGRVQATYSIEVVHDLDTLKQKLHQMLPGDDISVQSAQENIVLTGEVSSLSRVQAATDLAQSFIPECIQAETSDKEGAPVSALPGVGQGQDCDKGKVINMMQVGGAQQVMLKITVAEVARDVTRRLDTNLNIMNVGGNLKSGLVNGGATFPNALDAGGLATPVLSGGSPIGPPVSVFQPTTPTIDANGLFFSYLSGDLFLQAVLDVSKRNGLAKILSEPTLTTMTGQEAQFLSGGEFPIPVPQGGASNAVTIEFKEFGVGVKFLPVVLNSGRINLKLNVSVSEISQDNNVALAAAGTTNSFLIPSLTKRSAISTVELADGQTIGIAGLISDNVREFVQKFPGLGDIPGLGMLFRSQEFRSGQTELVIFVTPHLARPISAEQVRLPTDSFVPPSDREFYLMGRTEAKEGRPRSAPHSSKGGAEGAKFGHEF